MEKDKKATHLNVFLVKEKYDHNNQIINDEGCQDTFKLDIPGCDDVQMYVISSPEHPPKWSSLFTDYIDIKRIGNISNISAALLLRVGGRYFVITFGPGGRFLIKDGVCEERFGLLVALNAVDKESFRCIDKQSLDMIQSHTRIQSGHETTSDQFGLDVEQDMLKAIVGSPSDSRLGSRMTGTDSLSVSVRMDMKDLNYLLNSYREKYEKDLSKTDYQWVNNISIINNTAPIVSILENKLLEMFSKKEYTNIWLAIPEIIQWDLVKGFCYTNGGKRIHSDIKLSEFLKTVEDERAINLEILKQRHVFCVDEDHNKVFKSWPIYKCIYSEIDHEGNKYILNDGKWFNVNVDFVDKTNVDFSKISLSALTLPPYRDGGEGSYNTRVVEANPHQYALLDDKNKISHGGGHGQVEVCDLLSIDKELIHVKRYGKSNVFSHLFSQGYVSGQLLQLDAEFRRKVKERLTPPFDGLINVETRPAEKEFTIIFAVISDSAGADLYLPFFSRVNLNNTARTLKGFGYNIELLKIHVDDKFSKTTISLPSRRRR